MYLRFSLWNFSIIIRPNNLLSLNLQRKKESLLLSIDTSVGEGSSHVVTVGTRIALEADACLVFSASMCLIF